MAPTAGNRKGFSAIELMAVMAMTAILMGIGVPLFRAMLQAHRMNTTVSEFYAAINLARAEAIHRGARVDLMPADGMDWAKGWVVFIDRNGNHKAEEGDDILFKSIPAPPKMSIRSGFTDSSVPYIAYTGSGRSRTNANAQQPQLGSVTFVLEDRSRKIKLNFQGRPRICDPVAEPSTC